MIVLALVILAPGVLWHCWRLSISRGRSRSIRRIVDVAVGAGLFAGGTLIILDECLDLSVGLWPTLSIFLIFVLFIDVAQSALRFHVEDLGQ
mgnify:CR=1 FL=1